MKFSRKKIKRITKNIGMDLLRFAVYMVIGFLAAYAIIILVALPEIIGTLIFG